MELKKKFLLLTLTAGLTTQQPIKPVNNTPVALGIALIALPASILGVHKIYNYLKWSNQDILNWAETGTNAQVAKYRTMNRFPGSLLEKLYSFGKRTDAEWFFFEYMKNRVIRANKTLFPLHNALLIINQDRSELKKYQCYLIDRALTHHPCCSNFYKDLLNLLATFDELTNLILASPEHTREAQKIDEKLDRIHQQALDQERNEALKKQNNFLRNEKSKTDITIINNY